MATSRPLSPPSRARGADLLDRSGKLLDAPAAQRGTPRSVLTTRIAGAAENPKSQIAKPKKPALGKPASSVRSQLAAPPAARQAT
eukprot:6753299-Prymnesium_polylepis.1